METAVCPICGKSLPLDQFDLKIRGLPRVVQNLRRCKQCARLSYLEGRAKPKRVRQQQRASQNWKKNNPERHAELAREYRRRYPEKLTAQNRLNYAIRKGRIQRQPCEVCGATEKVHAHHISYRPEDWYNVQWLCHVCHKIEHG